MHMNSILYCVYVLPPNNPNTVNWNLKVSQTFMFKKEKKANFKIEKCK